MTTFSVTKTRIAVHKFSSCDGCQLAFLNAGEALLELAELVEIAHFAEAGVIDSEAEVDIAFIEGSVTTPAEERRIDAIRQRSRYLVSIGVCATAGGLQALRNIADAGEWPAAIYASPQFIDSLPTSTPIASHVKVDFELWGCPVNGAQVLQTVRSLLAGVTPRAETETLCGECKRQLKVCVMVAKGEPCMGPVTRAGCGAICPSVGRGCYACYGPAASTNTAALAHQLHAMGLTSKAVADHFLLINSAAPAFKAEGLKWRGEDE
ncbi:sulfhydrogenase subunit delta [Solemya pervernicosa gill symbiont]|uniref:Sulfhydrogenase subunit delta n=3 Tax=Gammaproteobacteria incertae sedis TaxID=118884 RepID=A0A1T2L591_9GAMM|nr:sulfhydrogenase subunit delta [Solemya pervernicosa gill symbiont]QKQ28270.1 sulfhydrogenase subunit delta [Candidatus Reidiella endopervernicosa]